MHINSRWSDRNNWYLKAHFLIYSLIFFTTQITSTFRVFPASCSSAAELSRCSKRGKFEWCLKAMNLQCLLFPPLTSPRHSGFSQLLSALKQLILKLKTWGAASDNDHLTIICWHFQKNVSSGSHLTKLYMSTCLGSQITLTFRVFTAWLNSQGAASEANCNWMMFESYEFTVSIFSLTHITSTFRVSHLIRRQAADIEAENVRCPKR